ncbi:hypothetical protein HWHPT5561_04880 [Petrotoga sp. HWH.PT.55.6.1]|uniref:hypothetical protein n=1 Tax=unclassified Petrotoga TaxID=2620614 RepID=UPI000CA03B28|nr:MULTISPECIES: hypothetical protein [unclassified Petrotoga]PNR93130.1 hypothetical protein X926_04205 [Petrotoga sp. HWHPT.55.6.3]RPD35945.1 hypothetical protein HWHPT5561_04880 [Petrotoga sp. HWH.PT.55.6.1]
MRSQDLFLKLHYNFLKKELFESLKTINEEPKSYNKNSLGIYVIKKLAPKSIIKYFADGINQGFYIFFFSSNKNIPYRKLHLISEVVNIYGIHLILFLKNDILKLFNNQVIFINQERSLTHRLFSINSYKISFILPEEMINPAVITTLKIQEVDLVFSKSPVAGNNQDLANNLLAYVLTDQKIFSPSILEEDRTSLKEREKIWLNLSYLKAIKDNYLEKNYNDLQRIKTKIDLIQR